MLYYQDDTIKVCYGSLREFETPPKIPKVSQVVWDPSTISNHWCEAIQLRFMSFTWHVHLGRSGDKVWGCAVRQLSISELVLIFFTSPRRNTSVISTDDTFPKPTLTCRIDLWINQCSYATLKTKRVVLAWIHANTSALRFAEFQVGNAWLVNQHAHSSRTTCFFRAFSKALSWVHVFLKPRFPTVFFKAILTILQAGILAWTSADAKRDDLRQASDSWNLWHSRLDNNQGVWDLKPQRFFWSTGSIQYL